MKPTQSMTSMLVERSENDGTPSTRIITDGTVMTQWILMYRWECVFKQKPNTLLKN